MRQWTAGFLTTIAALAGAATAQAAAIPASTLVGDFNAIIENNFFTTSDTEGNVLIGGNLGGNGILDTDFGTSNAITPPANFANVNVFGNNAGTWAESGQLVYVGGPSNMQTGNFGSPGAGSQTSGHLFANNFATDIWAPLTGLQSTLAGMPANTPTPSTFNPSTGVFTAHPTNGVAVWNLTTTQLNAAITSLSISGLPSTDTGVVNVMCPIAGCSFTSNQTWFPLSPLRNVIFDFENTANVMIDDQWETSIIATDSEVFNTAPIEGTLVAESYGGNGSLGSGELHNDLLMLCTPGTPGCFLNPPLPEPGSLALLGSALAGFAAMRRRRRG
jgi:hypothetical protein